MIETVLDEVLAAEREAARLKAEAETEARDIGLKSHAQAEQAKAEKNAAIRAQVKEILAAAEREAEAESRAIVHKAEAEAEELLKAGERNIARAAEIIADAVMRRNR